MAPLELALRTAARALAEVVGHLPLLSRSASLPPIETLLMLACIGLQAVDLRRRVTWAFRRPESRSCRQAPAASLDAACRPL
jgi:hypothetical protein